VLAKSLAVYQRTKELAVGLLAWVGQAIGRTRSQRQNRMNKMLGKRGGEVADRPVDLYLGEILRTTQACPYKVRSREDRASKVCVIEHSVSELRPREIGAIQPCGG